MWICYHLHLLGSTSTIWVTRGKTTPSSTRTSLYPAPSHTTTRVSKSHPTNKNHIHTQCKIYYGSLARLLQITLQLLPPTLHLPALLKIKLQMCITSNVHHITQCTELQLVRLLQASLQLLPPTLHWPTQLAINRKMCISTTETQHVIPLNNSTSQACNK